MPRYAADVSNLVDGLKPEAEAMYVERSSATRPGSIVRRSGLKAFAALLSDLAPIVAFAHEAEASEWKSALEHSYGVLVAARARQIEHLFAGLPSDERSVLLHARDAAATELANRKVISSADSATSHTPGILLLEYRAQQRAPTVALGKRVSLVPGLRP